MECIYRRLLFNVMEKKLFSIFFKGGKKFGKKCMSVSSFNVVTHATSATSQKNVPSDLWKLSY